MKTKIPHWNNFEVFSLRRILEKNFLKTKEFYFIQVGANDGVSFDFLYDFVTERNSKGVVVEPILEYFIELKKNYINFNNIIKVNKAVHPFKKREVLYKVSKDSSSNYPDWVKGIASFYKDHHKNTNIDSVDILEEEVACDTLMNIIDQNYNYKRLDFFQVDTEGFDYQVLKMLNIDVLKPNIIKFENVHLKNFEERELERKFKGEGYFIFKENNDTIALNLNVIKL